MKITSLKPAITMAISAVIFSGSVMSTQAYADALVSADNNSSNVRTTETYMLPGIGIGAATGTVIAGPVGLLVGGLIGAAIGSNQEITAASETTPAQDLETSTLAKENRQNKNIKYTDQTADTVTGEANKIIHLAQAGPINTVIEEQINSQQEEIMNILVTDLSLDVYFRSGSTDIESFYPVRLTAIANLINTMDKLELHLDGYADRRGEKLQNIELANKRIEKVRQQLINAGVAENRIITKAFGEIKTVSAAGDLEAYTFDRKVVIRFERAAPDSIAQMTKVLSDFTTEDTVVSNNEKSMVPVAAKTPARF